MKDKHTIRKLERLAECSGMDGVLASIALDRVLHIWTLNDQISKLQMRAQFSEHECGKLRDQLADAEHQRDAAVEGKERVVRLMEFQFDVIQAAKAWRDSLPPIPADHLEPEPVSTLRSALRDLDIKESQK